MLSFESEKAVTMVSAVAIVVYITLFDNSKLSRYCERRTLLVPRLLFFRFSGVHAAKVQLFFNYR